MNFVKKYAVLVLLCGACAQSFYDGSGLFGARTRQEEEYAERAWREFEQARMAATAALEHADEALREQEYERAILLDLMRNKKA